MNSDNFLYDYWKDEDVNELVRRSEIKDAKKEDDVVKQIAEDNKINYQDFVKVENGNASDNESKSGKYDAIIIVAIFVVLIGGFAGLVVLGKK